MFSSNKSILKGEKLDKAELSVNRYAFLLQMRNTGFCTENLN